MKILAAISPLAIAYILIGMMSLAHANNLNSYVIRIIDGSATQQPEISSVEAVNDPHFRSFITSVLGHVLPKSLEEIPFEKNSNNKPMINLVFVRYPLVASENRPILPVPSLDVPKSGLICRLDSPWVKLVIRQSAPPLVQAVFIWNERQFLIDQVLLSDESHSLITPPIPLTNSLFMQYSKDYADFITQLSAPAPEHIPADILWLFRKSWQSTRGPFWNEAMSSNKATVERIANSYTSLVLTLSDQCLEPLIDTSNFKIRYESILNLKDIFALDSYQINRLR